MNDEPQSQDTKTLPGGERTNGELGRSWGGGSQQHKNAHAVLERYDETVRLYLRQNLSYAEAAVSVAAAQHVPRRARASSTSAILSERIRGDGLNLRVDDRDAVRGMERKAWSRHDDGARERESSRSSWLGGRA
jgi:hypothetical protein